MMAALTLTSLVALSAAGLETIVTLQAEGPDDGFGREMAWIGDVNADGIDDFLVIAPGLDGPGFAGRVYVYFGGPGLDETADLVLQCDASGPLSESVDGPIDLDGDGHHDIVVAAPTYDVGAMENAGSVFVWRGGPDLDATVDHVIQGPWTDYNLGRALARAGACNPGDEYDDLVVTMGGSGTPTVYLYLGGPDLPYVLESAWGYACQCHDGFSSFLEYAGDANGDGRGDFVHGRPGSTGLYWDGETMEWIPGAGSLFLFLGGDPPQNVNPLYALDIDTEAGLGAPLDGGFDFDGDGHDDIIAAASAIAESRLFLGAGGGSGGTLAFVPGASVAGLGDVNGDGYDDLAIADVSATVAVFWGGAEPDAVPDQVLHPEPGETWSWPEVSRAGDVDHDGLDDIMVRFRRYHLGQSTSFVRVYRGSVEAVGIADLPPGSPVLRYEGAAPNPFNPSTRISFATEADLRVLVRLHDARGRLVRTLADAPLPPGRHSVTWDGRDDHGRRLPSGVYLVRVVGGGRSVGGRVVMVQ